MSIEEIIEEIKENQDYLEWLEDETVPDKWQDDYHQWLDEIGG